MACAPVLVQRDEMECSVCHEQFTEPKVLPCGHLLCCQCLLSWLDCQDKASCPLCRSVIVEPDTLAKESVEDIVNSFPTDLTMTALVKAQSFLSKKHDCCVCDDVTATSLCLDCWDFMCNSCRRAHQKMSMSKNHVVQDLASLTAEQLVRPPFCAVHADKVCKSFCNTHDTVICELCRRQQHRGCSGVKELQEKVQESFDELEKLEVTLAVMEGDLQQAVKHLDKRLKMMEERRRTITEKADVTCNRLQTAVQACRHRLKKMAMTLDQEEKETLQIEKSDLIQRLMTVTTHKRIIDRVKGVTASDSTIAMATMLRNKINCLDCSVGIPDDPHATCRMTLTISPDNVTWLENGLSQLGQVKVISTPSTENSQRSAFVFHDNHSFDIVLTNKNLTAERTCNSFDGLVISSVPMEFNKLYQVQVDETDTWWDSSYTFVGVLTDSPDSFQLPVKSRVFKSSVIVSPIAIWQHGLMSKTTSAFPLLRAREGGRLGLSLDTDSCLHVLINGQDTRTVVPVTQPCYALFDISFFLRKVTALPITEMDW